MVSRDGVILRNRHLRPACTCVYTCIRGSIPVFVNYLWTRYKSRVMKPCVKYVRTILCIMLHLLLVVIYKQRGWWIHSRMSVFICLCLFYLIYYFTRSDTCIRNMVLYILLNARATYMDRTTDALQLSRKAFLPVFPVTDGIWAISDRTSRDWKSRKATQQS